MKALRLFVVTAAAGMLTLGLTVPAAAETTGTSTATLTITGGALAITVNNGDEDLGTRASTLEETTISGRLGRVVVSDRRSAPAGSGWVASVVATDFTPDKGPAIPASRVGYTAGTITKIGTATYKANNPQNLRRATAAVTASDITGNNTASWTPTISVNLPPGLVAGEYSATITHSVL